MIDASDSQVIQVVQESPIELLFKDRYFVSGIGSELAERFKDPALLQKSWRLSLKPIS